MLHMQGQEAGRSMSPRDARHGTDAGYMAHKRADTDPCEACRHGHMVAQKHRRYYGPRKVSALGSQRRIKALQALGWSKKAIAQEIGYSNNGAIAYLMRAETMLPETAAKIAAVYNRLHMTVPQGPGPERARTWARRQGFSPPLAWDDIDNDPAPRRAHKRGPKRTEIDEAMIWRVINGGPRPRKLTPAEAAETVRRLLARGFSPRQIEQDYGIKPERYVRVGDAA